MIPDSPNRREVWEEALTLPSSRDLRSSLVRELADYLDIPEGVAEERCRTGERRVSDEWREAAPENPPEVTAFYRDTDAYLYDLTWWHALAGDESALAALGALESATDHRARSVLDFGSGVGSLGLVFARHGFEVTLSDVNASLDDYARWRFERRGLSASFLDPETEDLPEAAFDFVCAVDVLEHLPDPVSTLGDLASALRVGGTLFIHLPPEADSSRPMHLWHDENTLLSRLEESGLWLEEADGPSLTLRRGPPPLYSLERGLEMRRTKQNPVLLSKRPLMAMGLNPRAAELLDRLGERTSAARLADEARLPLVEATTFLEDLVEKRVLLKESRNVPARWPSVTVIVPSRDRPTRTRACVESLLALDYPQDLLEIIVVDDASETPLSGSLADLSARVLRLEENVGQSAARNLAAAEARGEILAFTDNDCVAESGWLRSLVTLLCEPKVEVAGGRVLSPERDGPLAEFEAARSPLDMGATASEVGYDRGVAYLPSCNLAVGRETLLRLGGFDEGMSLGEDVDFVWRAVRAGAGARYEPDGRILHHHRTRLAELLRRRADYASSEADLQLRHPETRRRMMIPTATTMLLAALPVLPVSQLASSALFVLAALILCAEIVTKRRRLRGAGVSLSVRKVAAAVARQHGAGLYHFGANVARYYSLPLLALSLLWPTLLPIVLVLISVPAVVDHRRLKPALSPFVFVPMYWLELAAYQLGVWRGCLERRTLRPLLPIPEFRR